MKEKKYETVFISHYRLSVKVPSHLWFINEEMGLPTTSEAQLQLYIVGVKSYG
jgi:hypothetical protein